MRSQLRIAALLGAVLVVGCSGRTNDNIQTSAQDLAAAPASAPAGDQNAAPPALPAQSQHLSTAGDKSASRAPAARRDAATPRGTSASRNDASVPDVGLPARENNRVAEVVAPAPRAPQWREVSVPAGTALPLEMTTALSSESAQVETPVSARLRNAIVINGDTAIPAGAVVTGTVTDVERSGRVQGRAHLSFAFNQLRLDGGREDLQTNPVTFEAEATKGEDATKVGAGAIGGAIIGGILGGKKGAGKGAVVGGAAGTGVVLATRGKEVTVADGAAVTATLAEPLTLRLPIR